jgi:hypothetical protein
MKQVMAPAKACKQVDGLSGVRYTAKDGRYTMSDRDAKALKDAGGFYPNLQGGRTRKADGFTCTECTRQTWFKVCGKCGATCTRNAGSAEAA